MASARVISDSLVLLPTRAIRTQGQVNCCLSCAIGACLEAAAPSLPELAPLFHFHFAGGPGAVLTGIPLSAARSALRSAGICALAMHDFAINSANVAEPPSSDARRDGLSRRPMDPSAGELLWFPVPLSNSKIGWRARLRRGIPLLLVIAPNPSYRSDAKQGGRLQNGEGPRETILHAVAVIGYSDEQQAFLIQDSRGASFGLDGQWWLPWDLAGSPFVEAAICFSANN